MTTNYTPAKPGAFIAPPGTPKAAGPRTVFTLDEVADGHPEYIAQHNQRYGHTSAERKANYEREAEESRIYAEKHGDRLLELLNSAICNLWLLPSDEGKLFAQKNGKCIGEAGSPEHEIHIALSAIGDADDDAERAECIETFYLTLNDYPREALRYFTERAAICGENCRGIITSLKIKSKLAKGAANV